MTRLAQFTSVLALGMALTTAAVAESEWGPHCGTQVEVMQATLANGDAEAIDALMGHLLDDANAKVFLASLTQEDAQPWFGVVFHPAFLDTLVTSSPERIAAWDAVVTVLEGARIVSDGLHG
ncbi:hypothetical protein [Shimia ponticola]|uniref:hypothetical protein n=1 Tax=Shimia ponticola TaxID=2582893 RepID=UPI0011BD82D6|nr:hypothetical protein [Shimia ponticola]